MEQTPAPRPSAVVGTDERDPVRLSACVYKNRYVKKSLTVHHLQRRLVELGFDLAGADLDGQYGDLTKQAVAAFQTKRKLGGEGLMDAKTFGLIFKGDPNVAVSLD